MSEDAILTIIAILLIGGALFIGVKFQNSKGIKILKIIPQKKSFE